MQTLKVEILLDLDTSHVGKEVIFCEHNYSDEISLSDSSL